MKPALLLVVVVICVVLFAFAAPRPASTPSQPQTAAAAAAPEAPTGFDDASNGFSDADRRTKDQDFFEEVEEITPDGLGPVYNAQSCRECHQTPVSGAASQVSELRVGHLDAHGRFQNPVVPIDNGKSTITGRTLINDRAICPEVQEHAPAIDKIRTFRLTTNILGDGYVEAIPDETLLKIRREQCRQTHGRICGQAVYVPVPESEGADRIGRFGWKDQHASLLAFAGDAYLNEMGITNRLQKDEVTTVCNPPVTTTIPNKDKSKITEPNSLPNPDDNNLEDIDRFASFMRSLKAPARDATIAATPEAKRGQELFRKVGCAQCHTETIVTGKSPASEGGPGLHLDAVENRTIHPYGDFLMHNVGTGDGIAIALVEHFGRERMERRMQQERTTGEDPMTFSPTECSEPFQTKVAEKTAPAKLRRDTECAADKIRTAPLWGLRLRSRLMHDGESITVQDAIRRHKREALEVTQKFQRLTPKEQKDVLAFLASL
jgi:CxxC motif-containing protein (DUF1111 family)